jgi:hypothetical protein
MSSCLKSFDCYQLTTRTFILFISGAEKTPANELLRSYFDYVLSIICNLSGERNQRADWKFRSLGNFVIGEHGARENGLKCCGTSRLLGWGIMV